MAAFSRVVDIELVGPTSIGLRLTDEEGTAATGQIVVSPVNFITDFSVFLTAVRAGGETRPVDADSLCRSWEEAREALRRRLIEEDPWGEEAMASADEQAIVALGEERLEVVRGEQENKEAPSSSKKPPASPK